MTSKVLCIYHADSCDGLGAAWAVYRALGEGVEFRAVESTGEKMFNGGSIYEWVAGRDLLILGVPYSLNMLRAMAREARSVLVLSPYLLHGLAEVRLPPSPWNWIRWQQIFIDKNPIFDNLALLSADQFSPVRSLAGLTWDYLHPNAPRPRIIDLIEDKALGPREPHNFNGGFRYSDEAKAFHAVLMSYDIADLPAMFERLDLISFGGSGVDPSKFRAAFTMEGYSILRAQRQAVDSAVAASCRTIKIAGHVVPCANVPPAMASDAGHLLCERGWFYKGQEGPPPFSVTYHDGADGRRHFSLRSPEGGVDVGQIAKQTAAQFNDYSSNRYWGREEYKRFGGNTNQRNGGWTGGGHAHAAGFDAPLGWEGE